MECISGGECEVGKYCQCVACSINPTLNTSKNSLVLLIHKYEQIAAKNQAKYIKYRASNKHYKAAA